MPANRLIFQKYISAKIKSGEVFPLDGLMQLVREYPDAKRNELFSKQSAAFFDFLVKRQSGKARLCKALISSRNESIVEAVLRNFRFKTVADLEKVWKEFSLKKENAFITTEKLSLRETRKRLREILPVELDIVDPETLKERRIVTGFDGMARDKNRYRANAVAFEKYKQLQSLRMRSKKEYLDIIGQYQECLMAMLTGRFRKSLKIFEQAEEMRKKMESTSLYLKLELENNEDTGN